MFRCPDCGAQYVPADFERDEVPWCFDSACLAGRDFGTELQAVPIDELPTRYEKDAA